MKRYGWLNYELKDELKKENKCNELNDKIVNDLDLKGVILLRSFDKIYKLLNH
jgi:CO dehydrogenase/acetyl-CoA synthase beta subunit